MNEPTALGKAETMSLLTNVTRFFRFGSTEVIEVEAAEPTSPTAPAVAATAVAELINADRLGTSDAAVAAPSTVPEAPFAAPAAPTEPVNLHAQPQAGHTCRWADVELHDIESDVGTEGTSIAGETVLGDSDAEPAVAVEPQLRAPTHDFVGTRQPRGHAKKNSEPEVGNFGLFFGNWGTRATVENGRKQATTSRSDLQIHKCAAQVICLAEASRETEERLKAAPVPAAVAAPPGLESRATFQHHCIRGDEESSVLVAARTDVCHSLELLDFTANDDHSYKLKKKTKMARTRTMICKATFKQNIGHIGTDVVVCVVHLHFKTAKLEWPSVAAKFWDALAAQIKRHGVKFLTGDFNMSLTEVCVQLRSRGVESDCIAWYPWLHADRTDAQPLGLDSCGMFYIGGSVEVRLDYSLLQLDILTTAVAGHMADHLHEYAGQNTPGQPWTAYQPKKKDLRCKLTDLLLPSTTAAELNQIPKRAGTTYRPYLRVKQKQVDRNEWLVAGSVHNGAHFPLMIFTQNSSHRSEVAEQERREKSAKKRAAKTAAASSVSSAVADGSWQSNSTWNYGYQQCYGNDHAPYQYTDQRSWSDSWADTPWWQSNSNTWY